MPKTTYPINSFNGGEYSPLIYSRIDFEKRRSGASVVENFIPLKQGPITARPGSIYVGNVFDKANKTAIIPFEFNVNQAYIIEVGEYYFRFYKDHAVITGSGIAISGITQASQCVVRTSAANDVNNNDIVTLSSIGGMTELNGNRYVAKVPKVFSTGISFSGSTISDTNSSLPTDLVAGDIIEVGNATGQNNNGTYTVTGTPTASSITVTGSFSAETAGAKVSIEVKNYFRLRSIDGDMDTYSGDVNSTGYGAYTSGGSISFWGKHTPYSQSNIYDSDGIFDLGYAQSADTVYICHKDHFPRKLIRNGDTDWELIKIGKTTNTGNYNYIPGGPFLEPQDMLGTALIVASGVGVTPDNTRIYEDTGGVPTYKWAGFSADDVGRLVWLGSAFDQIGCYGVVVGFTNSSDVNVDPVGGYPYSTGVSLWVGNNPNQDVRFGLYNDTNGYPHRVTFFQDRLCFTGCPAAPQRIDMSKSGEYENFEPETVGSNDTVPAGSEILPDNAIAIALQSQQVNIIKWILDDEKSLLVGTEGGEWVVKSSNDGEAMTAENAQATQPSNYGSANVPCVRAGQGSLFVQRSFRKVREFAYSTDRFGYATPDMSQLSEHLTEGNIIEMVYQREPHSVVWMVRGDGLLLGLTYDRGENVYGWHKHTLGATTVNDVDYPAVVESIACIASPDKDRDELWLVVKRYINGQYERQIEYMDKDWLTDRDRSQSLAYQVDCGVKYVSPGTANLTGLDHLEGQTVKILADGATHPDKVVSSGGITVNSASYTNIAVGLGYTPTWESLEIESADTVGQGKKKRISFMRLYVIESVGGFLGRDANNMDEVLFRKPSDAMGVAVPLYTGYKFINFPGDWDVETKVRFEQRQPLPLTIGAAYIDIDTQDK